jgi:predicted AAA+ superfamily ATPase
MAHFQSSCYLEVMIPRLIPLLRQPTGSFFLWGPRQTGKSTLLDSLYPGAYRIDLLDTDALIRFSQRPALLREEVAGLPPRQLVVIDEMRSFATPCSGVFSRPT